MGVHRNTLTRMRSLEKLTGPELVQERLRAQTLGAKAAADREVRKLAILDLNFIPRETVEHQGLVLAEAVNDFCSTLRAELPALLAGMDSPAISRKVGAMVDEWQSGFADEGAAIWRRAEERVNAITRGDLKRGANHRGHGEDDDE